MKKVFLSTLLFLFMWCALGTRCYADNIVVVIDPGHGGDNLGAQVDGIVEKEINLKVATAMYKHLSMYEGVEVHMTHYEDEGLTLKKRAQIAKELNADYVISLHFNASEYHQLYGTECWVPYADFYEETYEMASYFIDEFTNLGLYNRGIKTRLKDDGDNYYGIIRESEKLDIPCVLVEHCHLDNENDAGYYETDKKLEELGVLDAKAVAKYLGLKSTRLGVDYSDYSLDITVPHSENTRDKTGPNECAITVKEYNRETGEISVILTAREEDSRLLYYDYSIDGGLTFTERLPLTSESIEFSVQMEDGDTPQLVARAYNLNDILTESNLITLEPVQFPTLEEDVPTIKITGADKEKEESRQKIVAFFILVLVLLLICFFVIITLYIVKAVTHKKRRKQKRLEQKRPEE